MRMILALLAVVCTACDSPTAPMSRTPKLDTQIRWTEIAPGCTPRLPLPAEVPNSAWDTVQTHGGTRSLTIVVLREDDILLVEFLRNAAGVYQVCYWDTSDN
jgi:hypothetical protein